MDSLLKLECGVRHYPWGRRTSDGETPYIADLLGCPAGEESWAELWLGAHPSMSAVAAGQPLNEVIASSPSAMLGQAADLAGGTLPFLLKILSCARPLSIQSHPDKATAERLHAESPELYPDDNHKPEIIIALTEFEMMAEFQPWDEVRKSLESGTAFAGWRRSEDLAAAAAWLSRLSREEAAELCRCREAEVLSDGWTQTSSDKLFLRLSQAFPGDVGTLFAYLLNYRRLEPGQSLYIGANHLHAYLNGTGVECMANSDNVIRAGLTPKPIDWKRLLATADFVSSIPAIGSGEPLGNGSVRYVSPAREFTVEFWREGLPLCLADYAGHPGILLVLEGEAVITLPSGVVHGHRGDSWFCPATMAEGRVVVCGPGALAVWAYC